MSELKKYFRVFLGRQNVHADECHTGNFIGTNFHPVKDLTGEFPDDWREFNKKFIPVFLEEYPDKTKIAAGLSCGGLHTVSKGIVIGDMVLSPAGSGSYLVGEVTSDYYFVKGGNLPHRRNVNWYRKKIEVEDMSISLRASLGNRNTVSQLTHHAEEIDSLISGEEPSTIISTDETVEDPTLFALEKHLEEFLVENWERTKLGEKYVIFEDEELSGEQFPTDTGPIDILAVSKDKSELLVVELKKGRASDAVVGQIQRYMGYVKAELAEQGQVVKGVIIASEDDIRLQRALSVTQNIEFLKYKVDFELY